MIHSEHPKHHQSGRNGRKKTSRLWTDVAHNPSRSFTMDWTLSVASKQQVPAAHTKQQVATSHHVFGAARKRHHDGTFALLPIEVTRIYQNFAGVSRSIHSPKSQCYFLFLGVRTLTAAHCPSAAKQYRKAVHRVLLFLHTTAKLHVSL
jgi:hypothetical protein